MKLKDLEMRCGECEVVVHCGKPFEEPCLCTNEAIKNMTEQEYVQMANEILQKSNYKIKKIEKIIAKKFNSEYSEIYAIDFDGTLHHGSWPEIGKPNKRLIKKLIQRKHEGATLILWTCREEEMLEKAVSWCNEHGLEFDAVNENTKENKEYFKNDTRKIFAHHYVDDKNLKIKGIKRGKI